ncbi:protein of unknown function [Candidatus Methylomirabilis oxygeniifera]|uniref:Uncharacterized protein n=1 Tax=Methylomirabilis oxygeniifera TaxID=671143 RepID=D5MIM9_METO1|nr:protein of unknown function [Candidatus Methylomirabilis oxyfera]
MILPPYALNNLHDVDGTTVELQIVFPSFSRFDRRLPPPLSPS